MRSDWPKNDLNEKDIALSDPNPKYIDLAKEQIKYFEDVLGKKDKIYKYEGQSGFHMGSTSIKDMIGKPLIDITILT